MFIQLLRNAGASQTAAVAAAAAAAGAVAEEAGKRALSAPARGISGGVGPPGALTSRG